MQRIWEVGRTYFGLMSPPSFLPLPNYPGYCSVAAASSSSGYLLMGSNSGKQFSLCLAKAGGFCQWVPNSCVFFKEYTDISLALSETSIQLS